MSRFNSRHLFTLALAAGLVFAAAGAQARTRSFSGTFTGDRGNSYQYGRTTTATPGDFNRQGSITGPNGGTLSRDATTTYGDGSYNRDVTVTGPNGGTYTHSGSGSYSSTP